MGPVRTGLKMVHTVTSTIVLTDEVGTVLCAGRTFQWMPLADSFSVYRQL